MKLSQINTNLPKALPILFPDKSPLFDYILQDDGDGPYISQWNFNQEIPSMESIDQAASIV